MPENTLPHSQQSPASDGLSHCADLQVLYNNGKVFVEGLVVPFDFQITPKVPDLDGLFVEIRHNGVMVSRDEPPDSIEMGEVLEIHLTFTAPTGLQGHIPFEIYIGYQKNQDQHCFISRKVHTCFRATEKSRKVIDALKIELINTINNTGSASDPKIVPSIRGLEAFCPAPDDPAADFKYIALPAIWTALVLHRAKHKPGKSPMFPKPIMLPSEAHLDRMTLCWATRRLQLIAGERVQFGRNRECLVVTRLERGPGQTEAEVDNLNRMVSGFHCNIELGAAGALLKDGGWDSKQHKVKVSSGHGTFLNGERILSNRPRPIPVDKPFTLSLAGSDVNDPGILSFDGELWSSGRMASLPCVEKRSPNQPACLVLRRRYGPAEVVVLLWKHVDLGLIESQLGKSCICREREAFLLQVAGRCEWLIPGRTIWLQGVGVRVEKYNSPGLSPASEPI